jgi:hypothetical protein
LERHAENGEGYGGSVEVQVRARYGALGEHHLCMYRNGTGTDMDMHIRVYRRGLKQNLVPGMSTVVENTYLGRLDIDREYIDIFIR